MKTGPIRAAAAALLLMATAAVGQGVNEEVLIDSGLHPLGDSLRAILRIPDGASAAAPVPGCVIVHGSGGLFKDGDPCGPAVESKFAELAEVLAAMGVASVAPSSFASRDPRFCEDNDSDFLQFAGAPFFNPGDGTPTRDDFYKMRRVVIRPLDLLAATDYLCSLDEVDCSRICMVGTSNGGTTMMSYVANDLERHLVEYLDTSVQREHETSSNFDDRQTAFANFPPLPVDLADRLANRVLPDFVQAISPGCSLRKLVPTVEPTDSDFDPDLHVDDLYYPAGDVELHLDIGTLDNVPDACWNGGNREIQAIGYEMITATDPSRYLVETYEGADHDLLGEVGPELHAKLGRLVQRHFFPAIFSDGFE